MMRGYIFRVLTDSFPSADFSACTLEADVFAFKRLSDTTGLSLNLALLVECKRSYLPFVFSGWRHSSGGH